MKLTMKIISFLYLLHLAISSASGKFENDAESLLSRLLTLERTVATQAQTIAQQETRLINQDKVNANQESSMLKQEKMLQNQQIQIKNVKTQIENQNKVISSQQNIISTLMTHFNMQNSKRETLSKDVDPSLEERVNYLEEVTKIKVLRTCAEMEQHGVKTSGFYNLDPDGDMIGNPPITAYCDFEKKVTEILHDADGELINISHCDSSFCYTKEFVYNSDAQQINSLIDLSTFCEQTFEFDCYMAPLFYGESDIGVWIDKYGEDHVYFDGANQGTHMCSCQNYNNCTGSESIQNTCNCDNPMVPEWMKDSGKITNKTALPVMGFKYGPLQYDTQQAQFSVGRLRCGGMKNVSSVPKTCRDLKLLGETRPGLYQLQDPEHGDYPKMSFCQLDEPGYGDDMEKDWHWAKMSSGPGQVFFSAKHSGGPDDITDGDVIVFDSIYVNEGEGLDENGTFTAPVDGVYDFKISGITDIEAGFVQVYVMRNDFLYLTVADSNEGGQQSISRAWALPLIQGDEIKLVKSTGGFAGGTWGLQFIGILM